MTSPQQTACFAAVTFATAGLLAWWFTGRMRELALRWGVLAHVSQRSSHTQPTPRLGGIGLALGFVLALSIGWQMTRGASDNDFSLYSTPTLALACIAAGWLGMFVTGLADDVRDLKPILKLACMSFAGAVGAVGFCLALHAGAADDANGRILVIAGIAALVWILFFTNAYNFMDGLDGLAGTFALVAALTFASIMCMHSAGGGALLAPLALAGAACGFLAWNRPPARVFMGDGGSLSTGYALACFPLLGIAQPREWPFPAISSLVVLAPFIFDVTLTLIRRACRGENVLNAHREHLYQRIQQTGLSHAKVLQIHLLLFFGFAGLAWICAQPGGSGAAWFAPVPLVAWWRLVLAREREKAKTG